MNGVQIFAAVIWSLDLFGFGILIGMGKEKRSGANRVGRSGGDS